MRPKSAFHGDPEHRILEVLLPDAMQKHGLAEDIASIPRGFVHGRHRPRPRAAIDFVADEKKKVAVLS